MGKIRTHNPGEVQFCTRELSPDELAPDKLGPTQISSGEVRPRKIGVAEI
jgi:hypothetical protein